MMQWCSGGGRKATPLFDVSLNTIAGQVVLMVVAVGAVAVLPIHSVGVVVEVIVGGCGSGRKL